MSRLPRRPSGTGLYHVMLRGVNRQRIFEDSADRRFFLFCLARAREPSETRILAYCLMDNHVHLLVEEGTEPLSVFMKRLNVRYVARFNKKYDRVGHLFQDRYRSSAVEDDAYLQVVILYIHFNPVVAGLCKEPRQYPWSSRRALDGYDPLVDVDRLEQLIPVSDLLRVEEKYVPSAVSRDVLGYEDVFGQSIDDALWETVRDISGATTTTEFQRLDRESKMAVTRALRSQRVPIRTIARITGLSRSVIAEWGT